MREPRQQNGMPGTTVEPHARGGPVVRVLTPDEAAALLKISRRQLMDLARDRRLKCLRMGHRTVRFTERDVLKFLEASAS